MSAVLILDDDEDMLDSLADLARHEGYECTTARSYDALVALGDRAHACSVAILDINLGPDRPNGIDAYRWLIESRFRGRIFFLTGHASNHPLVEEARRLGNVEIIEKPATLDRLRDAFAA
jgi:FixJ family two-component response regulator